MTLTELRYVVAVARERHFGKAAEACFVSQPTLSVAVRKLEDELGITLFERGRSEVVSTAVGERIVAQAQRVLEEAEVIRQLAKGGRDQLAGPIRLGVIPTVGPYLMPYLVPALRERAPDMPLLLEQEFTASLSEQLKRGELDAAVLALPFAEPGIEVLPLYREPFVVLLPKGHPWAARERIRVAELVTEPVLLPAPGNCFRDQVLEACPGCLGRSGGAHGSLHKVLQSGTLETIRHMVASGVGLAVLPCSAAVPEPYAESLAVVRPFEAPLPDRRIALAWRKSFPRPRALEILARAIRECGLPCVEPLA